MIEDLRPNQVPPCGPPGEQQAPDVFEQEDLWPKVADDLCHLAIEAVTGKLLLFDRVRTPVADPRESLARRAADNKIDITRLGVEAHILTNTIRETIEPLSGISEIANVVLTKFIPFTNGQRLAIPQVAFHRMRAELVHEDRLKTCQL